MTDHCVAGFPSFIFFEKFVEMKEVSVGVRSTSGNGREFASKHSKVHRREMITQVGAIRKFGIVLIRSTSGNGREFASTHSKVYRRDMITQVGAIRELGMALIHKRRVDRMVMVRSQTLYGRTARLNSLRIMATPTHLFLFPSLSNHFPIPFPSNSPSIQSNIILSHPFSHFFPWHPPTSPQKVHSIVPTFPAA
jgi:hypothetical protein